VVASRGGSVNGNLWRGRALSGLVTKLREPAETARESDIQALCCRGCIKVNTEPHKRITQNEHPAHWGSPCAAIRLQPPRSRPWRERKASARPCRQVEPAWIAGCRWPMKQAPFGTDGPPMEGVVPQSDCPPLADIGASEPADAVAAVDDAHPRNRGGFPLLGHQRDPSKPGTDASPQVMQGPTPRAVQLINERPGEPWSTALLAREAHVSIRALQDAFHRHVGVPPMTYLRQVRLAGIRRELEQASFAVTTVQAVATRWGMVHMGRFAASYQAAFGERPSETLRRPAPLR
jgi:AraC-like DNA-binding protein